MIENFVDDYLIFDTRNHLGFASALWTDRHIDVEHTFEALRPRHGLVALFRGFVFSFLVGSALTPFGRRHLDTVFAVRCEHTVESGEVDPWLGNQSSQLGNEIQRLKDDVRRAITVGRFELSTSCTPTSIFTPASSTAHWAFPTTCLP